MNPNQLDQDAVNLAKAIRKNESNDNFNARGRSGEFGAYQYTKPTWDAYSKKHLGRVVNLEQATPQEQNEVTYKQIKEWKDQGYNVGQIASMWNSGKPDAYLDSSFKGVNKYGATYDVPKYAKDVATTYQAYKTGQVAPQVVGPSTAVGDQPPVAANNGEAPAGGVDGGQKVGLIQGLAQTIARPFLKGAANIGAALEAGNKENYEKIQREGLDFGYLGKARPIGSEYNDKGEKRTFGQRLADTIGTGVEASTLIAPGGAGVKAAQAIKGGRALTVAAKGAFTGAEGGLLQGVGSALQEDDTSLGNVVKQGVIGTIAGGVTGFGLGLAGGQAGKFVGKGKQNAAINANTKVLKELENSNAPLRRFVESQKAEGFDPIKDIASTDLLRGSVDKEGIIRTLGDGGVISQYNKAIEDTNGVVRKILEKESNTIKSTDLQKQVFSAIEKSGLQGAAKKRAQDEAMADIKQFVSELGSNDIPLTLVQDAKVSRYKTLNYMNPESGMAGKAIAKGYKQVVEKGTKSVEVQKINREIQRHLANISFLEKLDGKRVQGGRLGKYVASTVGGIAGSHFGPLGTIVGADIAGRIMGRNLASKFAGKTGGLIPEASAAMKRAIRVGEGTERKLPVVSQASQFTDELPSIDFGKPAIPKGKKKMPGLPTIR